MVSEGIIGVIQQTPIPTLQQTHVLTLLVKDALEKGMKGKHIQNKYNVSRDFVHKIHFGKKRPGEPKTNNKKQ